MTEMHNLHIKDLSFGYGSYRLFERFTFSSTKRIILLRGPSGCGKTTLLKLIGGFLSVEAGCIPSAGHPVLLTLQDDSLLPWLSGHDNISKFTGILSRDYQSSPLYPLVESFLHRKAYQMSYGQRRSIELFRALLMPNRLMLWDEPFNFLDRNRRDQFINFITNRKQDSRFVITSHYNENIDSQDIDVFEFIGDPPYQILARAREQTL